VPEPGDGNLRRYKLNWLRHVTRININRMTEIALNYSKNGGRRLGRPLKSLLDGPEHFFEGLILNDNDDDDDDDDYCYC